MHNEVAYLLGLLFIALGASLGAHSDFGVSMIVGPAYVLHLYVSQFWPAFSFGVALMFRTYLTAEVYEMFVKEVSAHFKVDIHRFKTGYDCANLVIALAMSVIFFGFWPLRGVGIGTIICALINGAMIGWISRQFDKHIVFRDALPWRPFFTGDTI